MSSKTIYDKHGNRIGEDVITTDRDGRVHITHYDNHHNRVGRSFETTDHRGEVYMIHEDAKGNRLARSTVERDWWGDLSKPKILPKPDGSGRKKRSGRKNRTMLTAMISMIVREL